MIARVSEAAAPSLRRRLLLQGLGLVLPALAVHGWMLWSGSIIGNDYPRYQVK